jgi:hypothetical protein
VATFLCAAIAARSAGAHNAAPERPGYLLVGNQYFDATPAGFQAYLDTIRTTNPDLFARLAPDAERLHQRVVTGRTLLVAGLAAGVAASLYGIASRDDCVLPPATDPNFSAASAAWDACNRNNVRTLGTFGLIGVGLAAVGIIGALAVSPSRAELLELVNRHNRISPQPLQLQLGYDPVQRLARAGAVLSF